MPATEPEKHGAGAIWIAIATVFAAQVYLALFKSMNWDEFFHFHHIYEIRTGAVDRTLQVLYIRYFNWLFDLPLLPFDQLRVGRIVVLLFEIVTAASIYGIAKLFASRPVAALCALAYMTAGFVFTHIFAFRADPQATALLMAALLLYCVRSLKLADVLLIGVLIGVAGMITVKSAFYAPVFLGAFIWRWNSSDAVSKLAVVTAGIALTSIVVFSLLFFWHSSGLSGSGLESGGRELRSAGGVVFTEGLLPRWDHLLRQMMLAPMFTLMCIAAPFMWRQRLADRATLAMFTGFMLPLATLLFYRNSYPYFFVFLLAPVAIAIFPAVEWMAKRFSLKIVALIFALQAAQMTLAERTEIMTTQRNTELLVRHIFDAPVTYVDFCGSIGDYPRVYPFLTSGWGLQKYRAKGQPLLVQAMAKQTVPLVIANHRVIYAALTGEQSDEQLLPADAAAIRDNYVHHIGPIWVAGKRIVTGNGGRTLSIRVPGLYRIEDGGVTLNDVAYLPGNIVQLERGEYRITDPVAADVTLRWHVRRAAKGPTAQPPYFTNY